ncbi:hypothetical protein HDV03_002176 [Kappamyces sp. JEL0829]|nr:hypothetical protein HDV03_002176 [Kappamyces sp. JEL0829]
MPASSSIPIPACEQAVVADNLASLSAIDMMCEARPTQTIGSNLLRRAARVLPFGEALTRKYEVDLLLGEGVSASVISATRKSDEKPVAVKMIRKAALSITHWKRDRSTNTTVPMEIFVLKRLSHPHIVEFVEAIEDADYFYLVMELCGSVHPIVPSFCISPSEPSSNPEYIYTVPDMTRRHSSDLFDFIKSSPRHFEEPTIRKIFSQVADAVQYLHSNNYVHRDIKDENVIIDAEFNIKLVDFGASDRIPSSSRDYFTSFRGSPRYTPPEMFTSPKHRGPEVDMWCLGVLLFTLAYSFQPFATKEDILCHRFVSTPTLPRSEACRDLILLLLEPNPAKRATIDMVRHHPFLLPPSPM